MSSARRCLEMVRWLGGGLTCALLLSSVVVGAPPDDFQANLMAGRTAATAADWDRAIDHLHAAVTRRPTDVAARRELGSVYLRAAEARGDPDLRRVLLAMADLELGIALRLAPGDAAAKRAWAEVSVLNGNPDRALRLYEDLLAAKGRGDDADAARLFALYVALDKSPRGLYVFTEKLREQPRWQELRFLLATLHQRSGNPDEARRLYRQVTETGQGNERLRDLARAALRELGP